jgi:predicted RNase H-like nuclease (RuvC/YqgF family)
MVNTSIARFETENLILKEKLEQQTRTVVTLQDKLRSVEVEAVTKGRVLADKDRQLTKVQTALIVKEDLLGR